MVNQTYLNINTAKTATATWLKATGINVDNPEVMATLGWLPVDYAYKQYDRWTEELIVKGSPVLQADKSGYVQNFKVVPLNAEALASSLARFKQEALDRLNAAWLVAEQNGKLMSAVGFEIDANERANRDIQGLITMMESTGSEKTSFCAADNSFHEVSVEQLKTMQLEVIQYGQQIYAKKWQIRTAIEQAADFDAVKAVNISFNE